MDKNTTQCLIIGSGPAGYTAAIYASRAALNPILYEGLQPGGQLTTTTVIAETILAETLIIATGATAKYLGLPSEEKYRGTGVSACATCDGFFYRGKDVAVVGGGDTACEEASYLAHLCRKVYMIVRRDVLRASKAMQERVMNTENIEILWESQTREVLGDENGVTGVRLVRKNGEEYEKAIDGFFLAIGHHPQSDLFKAWIDTDENGYILTDGKSSRTNVEGVFAAGDVQDPQYRQAIAAAGSGCRAALDAERYILSKK